MTVHMIKLGGMAANCYLIEEKGQFILVDTGRKSQYKKLKKQLDSCGCKLSDLKLIIMTHGDFDHTGCGAMLQSEYGIQVAMHKDDAKMVETGDMFYGRSSAGKISKLIVNKLFAIERFVPDILLEDGSSLKPYGVDGTIIHMPGHSAGSIGILLEDGSLICGDLFENTKKPTLNSILDDMDTALISVEKVKGLDVKRLYLGHGEPFEMSEFDN